MATNLPSCFSIEFLEQPLRFLVSLTLLKYVKSQRSYGFLITKELIFGFQILDLKDHFSASLRGMWKTPTCNPLYVVIIRVVRVTHTLANKHNTNTVLPRFHFLNTESHTLKREKFEDLYLQNFNFQTQFVLHQPPS